MEMKDHMISDEELNAVAGGADSLKEAKFNVGDWVRYVHNADIVALITSRTPEEVGNGWKYGVKINGEGQELRWISECLMTKTTKPN